MLFFDSSSSTLPCEFRSHRAGSQLIKIKKMSERQTKAGNQITLSHSLILSLSHSFTLSFTHSQHAEQLLFSCLCSKISLSLSHSHTLSFNHSRHAEQVLYSSLCSKVAVYSRKLQCFFFDSCITLSCYLRSHRAGSQLKIDFIQYHRIIEAISTLLFIIEYHVTILSLIHIWRCRRIERCRSRWSPYH